MVSKVAGMESRVSLVSQGSDVIRLVKVGTDTAKWMTPLPQDATAVSRVGLMKKWNHAFSGFSAS